MDDYQIICQSAYDLRSITPFSQPGFFFNEPLHLQQQGRFHLLTAFNSCTRQTDARCAFFVQPTYALSPLAAPFGSVEFTENLPDQLLDAFIGSLLQEAQCLGAITLRLVHYPTCYAPVQTERLTAKLLAHGFKITENHATFFLRVGEHDFERGLVSAERRRLRKAGRMGFRVAYQLHPNVDDVISFVQETRQRKGYSLTIAPEQVRNLLRNYPDRYAVFAVMDGQTTAALTITVRVRHDVLYSFLPASNPDYATYSPMVLLTDGLFRYCQQQQIRLLDLGLSLDHNRQPKPSLMRFKRNLGAQESPKLVFERLL